MKLIEKVEISYFRSIYKNQITECADTNIIFGRNDSGKSNFLRALNLFFNNETSPGQSFRFDRDFNHSRRAEAGGEGDIRKFVYVKIWFKPPTNWRASLGEEFWVKKQWNISLGSEAILHSSIQNSKLQYLTRFLNKIRFHYIPAIKDRRIFENLQAEIYKVISAHAEFSDSLADFTQALRERTEALSDGLLDRLGINSVVSTPQDLTDLFRSLDFETVSEIGDSYSLTLQRGDGVQVRHIPLILSFLSERSPQDYHVWGFEEPENSLELANAIQEAETFRAFGSDDNKQIFLTSHSPAFFSLTEDDVSKYYVSRTEERAERLNSIAQKIDESSLYLPGELMGELPHLPVISSYLREAHEKIKKIEEAGNELSREIERNNQSIVFVEGEADQLVFEKAWEILIGKEMPFRFQPAGGTTKMLSLGQDGKILGHLAPERSILALVDNDTEGRNLYKNARLNNGGRWVRHNSNDSYWCRLPYNQEFSELMRNLGIDANSWPGSLENLFPATLRRRAEVDGSLRLTGTPHAELLNPQFFPAIQPYSQQRDDLLHFYILTADPNTKIPFARWIIEIAAEEPEIFEPLRQTFEGLREILAE